MIDFMGKGFIIAPSLLSADFAHLAEQIREAVGRGFAYEGMPDDPDLVSLHGDPEFEAILAENRRRLAQRPH